MEDSLEGDASLPVERLLKYPGGLQATLMMQTLHILELSSHKNSYIEDSSSNKFIWFWLGHVRLGRLPGGDAKVLVVVRFIPGKTISKQTHKDV